jgi:predicted MFS family arabinose efflux permease
VIFGGVAAANVLGVPLGTVLGELLGWRLAFGALGGLALAAMIALIFVLPSLSAATPIGFGVLWSTLIGRRVLAGLIITLLAVVGHFTAFTFVGPILRDVVGLPEGFVGGALLIFGIAGLIGNFLAGALLSDHLRGVVIAVPGGVALVLVALPILGVIPVVGIALLVLWGLIFGGMSVALQTWMIKASPDAPEAATGLWVCVWNAAIGIGAVVGGRAVDSVSVGTASWAGAGLLLLAAVLAVLSGRRAKIATDGAR